MAGVGNKSVQNRRDLRCYDRIDDDHFACFTQQLFKRNPSRIKNLRKQWSQWYSKIFWRSRGLLMIDSELSIACDGKWWIVWGGRFISRKEFGVSLSAQNSKSNITVQVVLMCFHSAEEKMWSWCDNRILPSPPPGNTFSFLSNQESEASRRILFRSLASGIANISHLPQKSGMLSAVLKPHPDQQRCRIRRGKDLSWRTNRRQLVVRPSCSSNERKSLKSGTYQWALD